MKKIKILQVAYGFEGGIGKLLVEYSKRINSHVEMEFLISHYEGGIFEKEIIDLGFKIHRINIGVKKHEKIKVLEKILSETNFDIVHVHGVCDYTLFKCARKYGIKVRIIHSHIAYTPDRNKNILHRLIKPIYKDIKNRFYITDYWACGKDSAIYAWGKYRYKLGQVYVMKNAIDVNQFSYSEEKRKSIRKMLNIENSFIVGNIGRLTEQKNHRFLLNVFAELKKIKDDAILLIIGDGELKSELQEIAIKLNIKDSVIFMGNRSDISELLNVMDVFILPSIFEGLPVVMIEAQANGLQCIVSDKVTKECSFLNENVYLSLDDSYKDWARQLAISKDINRGTGAKAVKNNGFDINIAAQELFEYYESLV